jgi:hypothetical protein
VPRAELSCFAGVLADALAALRERRSMHALGGAFSAPLSLHAGVFCTLGPAAEPLGPASGPGAAGGARRDVYSLPNLAALLRAFALPRQDAAACLTAHLTALGFASPRVLARKVAGVFALAPSLLPGRPVDFSVPPSGLPGAASSISFLKF